MERLPYRKRATKRILRDTVAFGKGRAVPLGIAVVGLIVAFLINHYYLHLSNALAVFELGLVSIGSSYAIFFSGSLAVNAFRAPWILDAESQQLMHALEVRALKAEATISGLEQREHKHDLFAKLMEEGRTFCSDLDRCQTPGQFASWDRHFADWIAKVEDEITKMGYHGEAVDFLRAKDAAIPVKGVINFRNEQEKRRRKLTEHQNYLSDFMRRRLPNLNT